VFIRVPVSQGERFVEDLDWMKKKMKPVNPSTDIQRCWLTNPNPQPATGVKINASLVKPIAALLRANSGTVSVTTVENPVKSTPLK
jgi:hypothetical protein